MDKVIEEAYETGKFPILYKINSRKKVSFWSINVNTGDDDTATIVTQYGQLGTESPVEVRHHVPVGKNLNRRNATTPFEQAVKQAMSKFKTKLKSMVINLDNIESLKNKVYPQLATDYNKIAEKQKIRTPCYAQAKLDGNRCISKYTKDKKVVMLSRRNQEIINFPHISDELEILFKKIYEKNTSILDNLYFDGELYNHNLSLQLISGLSNKKKNLDNQSNITARKKVEYHLYDTFDIKKLKVPYFKRYNFLCKVIKLYKFKHIKIVRLYTIKNKKSILGITKKFIKEGYEGTVLKKIKGVYKVANSHNTGRSYDIQKYKLRKEEEATIKSIKEINNKTTYSIIIRCINSSNGVLFDINGNGTEEYKKNVFLKQGQFIGDYIKYTYNGMTKSGKPREAVPLLSKNGTYIIISKDKETINYDKYYNSVDDKKIID